MPKRTGFGTVRFLLRVSGIPEIIILIILGKRGSDP